MLFYYIWLFSHGFMNIEILVKILKYWCKSNSLIMSVVTLEMSEIKKKMDFSKHLVIFYNRYFKE